MVMTSASTRWACGAAAFVSGLLAEGYNDPFPMVVSLAERNGLVFEPRTATTAIAQHSEKLIRTTVDHRPILHFEIKLVTHAVAPAEICFMADLLMRESLNSHSAG
jgi:hypothetical protein